jgi:uncharacterized protein with HEPN domain
LSPTLADRLHDILTAVEDVETILTGITREELAKDKYRRLAVERSLEILCEASRHIPDSVKANVDIPWRRIIDLGNLLRHAYHRVDPDTLWYIAQNDLPTLKTAVKELVSRTESG